MRSTLLCRSFRVVQQQPQQAAALVSPFGAALHGADRGPVATLPEPDEVWLGLLAASMPFRESLLVVTPTHFAKANAVCHRAGRHFLKPAHCPLPVALGEAPRDDVPQSPLSAVGGAAAPSSAVANAVPAFSHLPAAAFDAVCFVGNAFADIPPTLRPHVVTAAHRVLRPHGVVGIAGSRIARVVGPDAVQEDAADAVRLVRAHAAAMAADGDPIAAALVEREATIDAGHRDVYLPFGSVRHKWFESEYPAPSIGAVGDYLRGWPLYQHVVAPQRSADGDGPPKWRTVEADPFEALQESMAFAAEARALRKSGLHLRVDHFLVTCDDRPCNRAGPDEIPGVAGAAAALGGGGTFDLAGALDDGHNE